MEDLYFIQCGSKRKAEKHNCEYCGKEFLRRKHAPRLQKFCSAECMGKGKTTKQEVTCYNCNKKFLRTPARIKKSKHGFYFCSRKCKEKSQSLIGNCPEIRPAHFGTGTGESSYRDWMRDEIELGCISCSVNNKYLLLVHHKDGNRKNNKKENLEVVCANCHLKRHLKFNGINWIYGTSFLTPRDMLDKL